MLLPIYLLASSLTLGRGQVMPVVTRAMFVNALLDDYDNTVTPTFDKPYPTYVNVSLYINGINSVSEQSMDFTLNLFVTQSWVDDRLQFHNLIEAEYLELDSKLSSKFWVPDLYFVNEKSSTFHDLTVPNQLLHLYSDGTVVYKLRISLTASCYMDLHTFPMDEQICSLNMRSFGYTKKSLQFQWSENKPLTRHRHIEMSQFNLINLKHRDCEEATPQQDSQRQEGGLEENDTSQSNDTRLDEDQDTFTCLAVDFVLHRSVGFYMIQIYIPSALIVVLSWVSFCLDVDAVPARISLGILTVLTMTNMKTIAVSSLPKVSYIKAIDTWMAVCLSFVFASLLEFAMVNAFSRRQITPVRSYLADQDLEARKCLKGGAIGDNSASTGSDAKIRNSDLPRKIDRASMFLFPLSFFIFVLIYISTSR